MLEGYSTNKGRKFQKSRLFLNQFTFKRAEQASSAAQIYTVWNTDLLTLSIIFIQYIFDKISGLCNVVN